MICPMMNGSEIVGMAELSADEVLMLILCHYHLNMADETLFADSQPSHVA